VQGDAVHRGGHGMLADAIVNIAALKEIMPHRPLGPGAGKISSG